jgi:hypothetical protein
MTKRKPKDPADARRPAGQRTYPLEASLLLAKYQQLYDLEDRARTMSVEERFELRQAEAVPVWQSLREWLDSDAAGRVLPKSMLGEALGYLRKVTSGTSAN